MIDLRITTQAIANAVITTTSATIAVCEADCPVLDESACHMFIGVTGMASSVK